MIFLWFHLLKNVDRKITLEIINTFKIVAAILRIHTNSLNASSPYSVYIFEMQTSNKH
jgi:hypothetical protein